MQNEKGEAGAVEDEAAAKSGEELSVDVEGGGEREEEKTDESSQRETRHREDGRSSRAD